MKLRLKYPNHRLGISTRYTITYTGIKLPKGIRKVTKVQGRNRMHRFWRQKLDAALARYMRKRGISFEYRGTKVVASSEQGIRWIYYNYKVDAWK